MGRQIVNCSHLTMKVVHIDIWKLSIPMHPFRIATGTMQYAQNIFIRISTDEGLTGVGECSAFPMIVGETQATCFEMAKDFALLWKGRDAGLIDERLNELDGFTAFNSTAKSAFDMALYDLAAKKSGKPLYQYFGGSLRQMETDLTIGIDEPARMAEIAKDFQSRGVRIIKVKLGHGAEDDILRVAAIRGAVGQEIALRIDANQGWSFDEALRVLQDIEQYDVEFCEQPMRYWNDHLLPELRRLSPVKIMADESVYDHYDAARVIGAGGCDFVNIKFSKSGGIREAMRINKVCADAGVACMMGGMLESRVALTAFAHFASAHENIKFYDIDTCMLGHKSDPVTGGLRFEGFRVKLPDAPGIGADVADDFLQTCVHARI